MDLTKYLRAEEIELARLAARSPAFSMSLVASLDPPVGLAFGTIIGLVEGGPKVMMPSEEICRVLQHVDLNIGLEDYAQPYDTVGVIIPGRFLVPEGRDLLSISSWVPDAGLTVSVFYGEDEILIFVVKAAQIGSKTIEAYIEAKTSELDLGERGQLDRTLPIVRVILNLNLFALEKGVRILPLDPRAEKRRRKAMTDERMARLAARDAQEVVIQDLDLILRPSEPSQGDCGEGTGRRQRMHRRRGHWKMQVFGPGRTQRKRIYVHSYMVHADDDPDGEVWSVLS